MKYFLLLSLFISSLSFADYLDEKLSTYSWNGVEVNFLEDNQYPTFSISIYFAEGALGDPKTKEGATQMSFDLLSSGTKRYNQKEISDALEFYGTSISSNVTHEYSSFDIAGLLKYAKPSLKMVCHLFNNANYPNQEIIRYKKNHTSYLKNLITSQGKLADRIFREVSLGQTPFSYPVDGKISSAQRINQKDLRARLDVLNSTVKRIYIKGPKKLEELSSIFSKDCNWSGEDKHSVALPVSISSNKRKEGKKTTVYFVPVPKSNQAQIRIGRLMGSDEILKTPDLQTFASTFIGGGFTSRLMQELRVKNGLTYTVFAYASGQKTYGRAGITTFTKNETLLDALHVIKETLNKNIENIEEGDFLHSQKFILGNYLFSLESSSSFLGQIMYFDHVGRERKDIYRFPSKISEVTKASLQEMVKNLYTFKDQVILVLGDSSLEKVLQREFEVKRLNYHNYL